MKRLVQFFVAVAMASAIAPAFAQSNVPQVKNPAVVALQPAGTASGDWQPNSGPGETRAQVYQQLVHAQQDGQLSRLDRAVYAHH